MKRRDFLGALGGAAAAWPLAARAQLNERVRRIGILMNLSETDSDSKARLSAFLTELQRLGWAAGRNLQIDIRWGGGNPEHFRRNAAELLALSPDLVLGASGPVLSVLQEATRTVPIVFAQVIDPVGGGFVASLSHPGGNSTGFTLFDYGMSAKWLELLKQVAPEVIRVAVLHDPTIASGAGQWAAIRAAAPSIAVELMPIHMTSPDEIERSIYTFAERSNGGLIATASPLLAIHQKLIISLATQRRLPAIFPFRLNAIEGGLIAYGPDLVDSYRRAADYVDRILRGARPSDLPVQNPVKFEMVINLKTAKALGLTVSPLLLARADEVIE